MSEELKPQIQIHTYRLMTITGLVIDFAAPQPLENMWTILKGDGHFQMQTPDGRVYRRIPFHAIADLQYFDAQAQALAYVPAASGAKN
jgi:hypothetical protein